MDLKEGEKGSFESSKVCFLSNFPPRECGIATFTKDLSSAMDKRFNPLLKSRIVALNEDEEMCNYSKKVIMQINKEDIQEFIDIAKKINLSKEIKLVCIQHEFGLYGGNYGSYLVPFLDAVEKPVVTTFHSVLPKPDSKRKRIVKVICEKSAAVVVMAKKAIEILEKQYGVNPEKLHLVYHGIPSVPFRSSEKYKKKLNLSGKTVLSTFGLLSRGKGIEYMIRSLPRLVKKYPDLLYLIIGETHPVVREQEGESYRKELKKLVARLGLKKHVKFYNKYISLKELVTHLLATDIYICTNLEKAQIVSGTLSYALGCGRAVVSTPIEYAKEMLANGRGRVAKMKDPASFAKAIGKILGDLEFRKHIEGNAYNFSRTMTWPNVAARYLQVFNSVVGLREETTEKYPKISLNHLKSLTDEFGMLQFSKLSVPDKDSGYTVDDNSRALITAILHNKLFNSKVSDNLSKVYLGFLEQAQDKKGWFHSVMHKDKIIESHSEDAFGRAIWALGYTVENSENSERVEKAKQLFVKSFGLIDRLKETRAKAFALLGLSHYYKKHEEFGILDKINNLAGALVDCFKKNCSENWHWFEHELTYSNSKIPEALFLAYSATGNREYLEVAERSLAFLSTIVFVNGKLSPVGHNGWYNKEGKRAFFDQQPVDASSMVQTFLTAYLITKNESYYKRAVLAFNWFLGKNHLGHLMYDETTGGCYDGLSRDYINLNQGAESTIAYLMSRLFLEEIKQSK